MLQIKLSGNPYEIPNKWEELTQAQFIKVLDALADFNRGEKTLNELRQLTFLICSGLSPRIYGSNRKNEQKAENIIMIGHHMTFMLRFGYEKQKTFARLKKADKELLFRYHPFELEDSQAVRWAKRNKFTPVADMVFCKNMVPHIGRRRHKINGYQFNLTNGIFTSTLTASQFIDAQTVAARYIETADPALLNMLVAILYPKRDYTSITAVKESEQLTWLDFEIKKAIFLNFQGIQEFLFTRTKYNLVFNPDKSSKTPTHKIGFEAVAYSLTRAGFGNVDEMNIVKFLDVLYTELVSTVQGLHQQKIPIDEISKRTNLTLARINEII
jgi:hypothetical protein